MTKLQKDLIRESLKSINDKPIIVTLTKNQEITLKLKGRGSETFKVSIKELYNMLSGGSELVVDRGMERTLKEISTHSLIANSEYKTKVEIQRIINELLKK